MKVNLIPVGNKYTQSSQWVEVSKVRYVAKKIVVCNITAKYHKLRKREKDAYNTVNEDIYPNQVGIVSLK